MPQWAGYCPSRQDGVSTELHLFQKTRHEVYKKVSGKCAAPWNIRRNSKVESSRKGGQAERAEQGRRVAAAVRGQVLSIDVSKPQLETFNVDQIDS